MMSYHVSTASVAAYKEHVFFSACKNATGGGKLSTMERINTHNGDERPSGLLDGSCQVVQFLLEKESSEPL